MLLVTFLFIFFSFVKYKETVLFTASTLIFMNNLMTGIPNVKLFYLVALCQILIFFFKGYNHKYKGHKFPVIILGILILNFLEYIVSDWYNGWRYFSVTLVSSISYFFFPYIVWRVMETADELKLFYKNLLCFFLIVGGYALVEALLGYNIITQWANETGVMVGEGGVNTKERFGFTRCNSLLPWSSSLGMNSALVFSVLIFLNYKGLKVVKFETILLFLLPFCVLLSGTRAQFVVFVVCIIGMSPLITKYRAKYFKIFIGCLIVVIFAAFPFFLYIANNLVSSSEVGGSSTELRMMQLDITLYYWNQSPILGHGQRFIGETVLPNNPGILGAESIVFVMLMERGIVGLLGYYMIAVCLSLWCLKHAKEIAILPIAFALGKTMGAVIGVEYVIPLILCLFCAKANLFNNLKTSYIQR